MGHEHAQSNFSFLCLQLWTTSFSSRWVSLNMYRAVNRVCEVLSITKWSKLIGRYMMLSINIDRGESLSQLQILNLDLSQWKERPLCLLLFDSLTCYLVIAYGNFEHNKNILNIRGGLIWGKAYLEVIWYSQPNVDPMFLQFKRWPNFIFFGIL